MQSCYTDFEGAEWCADDIDSGVEPITIARSKNGKSTFQNVTKDLLYVDFCNEYEVDDEGVGTCTNSDQVPLFSEDAEDYFWEYDNNGLKLAQFRFYEVPTTPEW